MRIYASGRKIRVMSLRAAIIRHIEGLTVTQGQGVGDPFRVLPWQRRFLRGAWSTEGDAALTVGRGCGKTTLVAAIADATLRGPLRQPRAETIIAASSFSQARITFEHLLAFMAPVDRKRWRVADTRNRTAAAPPLRAPQRPPAAEAAGAAENGRPFPAPPWKTGRPVSHSYRSRYCY